MGDVAASEAILLRRDEGGVAWLTLNRPASRNALSVALLERSRRRSPRSRGTGR